MSRPWMLDKDALVARVGELRAQGITAKVIAARVGYSVSRIYAICAALGIKKQFKSKRLNTGHGNSGENLRESVRLEQTQSAGSGSDTGQPGD